MELAILPKAGLRIKGKQASIAIDPQDKIAYEASLLLAKSPNDVSLPENAVMITGPGEYEIGGIKMTGMRAESDMLYGVNIEGIDILVGKIKALDKMQHKLKEYNIVVALCDDSDNASFITSLASNVVVLYGDKAEEVAQPFGKENIKTMSKYSSTREKLPAEVETVLLS